jgi:hypothetical protein
MDADERLKQVTIPSPCTADWDAMSGDDRIRHCQACGKPVHNLRAMSTEEAASILATWGDDACCRITKNPDGTVLTAGQGASGQSSAGGLRFRLGTLMAVIAGIAAALGLLRAAMHEEPAVTMGMPCLPAQSATATPPPTAPTPGPTAEAGDQGSSPDGARPAP